MPEKLVDAPLLLDELRRLLGRVDNMRGYLDMDNLENELVALEKKMGAPDFWSDQEKAKTISRQHRMLKDKVTAWKSVYEAVNDALIMVELAVEEKDNEAVADIAGGMKKLVKQVDAFEVTTLLKGEYDDSGAIMTIHAGAGGTESQDWAEMLLRMYLRWAEDKGLETSIADITPGEEAGLKSVTVFIRGRFTYGFLRPEKGVHRLVRISPFDANKRRHTSFASVEVVPELGEDIDIDIRPEEMRIDTFRSSGAGGQHVNKTDSAIRITHLPTNIVVQCQNERSQHKNKESAMRILKARLFELKRREQTEKLQEIQGELKDIAWGSQIRSYVFQPYTMVKDLRTRHEKGNIQAVMDGDLDDFIWAYLKMEASGEKRPPLPVEDDEEG